MCEDAAHAGAVLGPLIADALVGRIADLRAAEHMRDLPFAEFRPADGNDPELVVVGLTAERRLVVAANHERPPTGPSGAIAWEHVSRIIILRLE